MNVNKLKGKIVEKGMNVDEVSLKMGVDRSTIYRKLNNNGETFTVREVKQIVSILELTQEEVTSIFFSNTVA